MWGFPPHLKAPPRRGFLIPFSSPARCPSFNTGLISFLLPAQRCRWEHRTGPCREGGAPPRHVSQTEAPSLPPAPRAPGWVALDGERVNFPSRPARGRRWRPPCGGPEWWGGEAETARALGPGVGGGKHFVLCVCEYGGPPTRPSASHPHRAPTSLAAPGVPLMCAPQGRAVGRCGLRAAPPRPRAPGGGTAETKSPRPGRPARRGLPVCRRREEETSDAASGRSFSLGTGRRLRVRGPR